MIWNDLKYFSRSEFDSPDILGSGNKMDSMFLYKLDKARRVANISFKILSGFRTHSHNKKIGGVSDSSHLKGLAADIWVKDSRSRFLIVFSLMSVGFNRIGIGKNFVHVDDDLVKPKKVIWLY